jgi:hypothetical protein
VDITGLAPNTYNGSIQVTGTCATNTPQIIPVQLTVTAPPQPTLSLSRTSLTFTATAGGANPADQSVSISNSGSGSLVWTASVVPGASWLGVVPGSGTDTGTLTVSANIAGLAPNTYKQHPGDRDRRHQHAPDHRGPADRHPGPTAATVNDLRFDFPCLRAPGWRCATLPAREAA